MPALVILLAAMGFAAAVFVFVHTSPTGPEFWYGHPWFELLGEGKLLMLFVSAALFTLYAIWVIRRASATFWFFALAASSFPALAALLPIADHMDVAKHSDRYLDAGGDVFFQILSAERVYVLSLAFSVILGLLTIYGYFAQRKT